MNFVFACLCFFFENSEVDFEICIKKWARSVFWQSRSSFVKFFGGSPCRSRPNLSYVLCAISCVTFSGNILDIQYSR